MSHSAAPLRKGTANHFVICNCCRCSCLPIMVMRTFKRDGYCYIPSTYRAVVDPDACQACGTCIEACNFDERLLSDGRARVLDCQGCGHCIAACPSKAGAMVARWSSRLHATASLSGVTLGEHPIR